MAQEVDMALSEREQRLLEQMEAALAAEDPDLAEQLRGHRHHARLRWGASMVGFVVGVLALVVGLQLAPWVSVTGFVLMLVSAVVAVWSRGPGVGHAHVAGHDATPPRGRRPRDV
jgi:uncharacterized membrane protein YphA (DoxX/SURF4 family)